MYRPIEHKTLNILLFILLFSLKNFLSVIGSYFWRTDALASYQILIPFVNTFSAGSIDSNMKESCQGT